MKAQERHHLKQNEFAVTTARLAGGFAQNRDRIVMIGGAVILIAAIAGAYFYFQKQSNDRASAAFGAALRVEQSQVVPAPTLPGATQQAGTFATDQARNEAAVAAYQKVIDAYPSHDAGMAALRSGNYDKAVSTFREVVTNYPTGELASNAQFWMGESYYTKGDLESAVTAYRKVLSDWPASRKAPDAMVKLGFSLSDLKRTGEARSTLEEVVRKYPGTNAAQLAADRLKRLGR